ncbi:hypothetical protein BKA67DRAFT_541204 [Truncatella angustata]|uniref:T6SS Phospholipase effector Tle1-like catalytic domain-containing protein n=1 Tax=Truncatella angustata TaxID=152316 RepID=A0A9P8RI08_9PEZI|nr:uncharacterized protein BKA67DRAFT_541204 [Truncatella angustata]KAH6646227.1 hypothetical protein BKA67DRAFT_541204 [Truncatella angustata]KAH8203966.1 hypothetical protein TruAng_001908 [Truncatella angustata]
MSAHKRLIIACDGTWLNSNDGIDRSGKLVTPSNITRICRALLPESSAGIQQIVYYQSGLGSAGSIWSFLGGFVGAGIGENIREAYAFLCNNYDEGDEIFLIGFSRGAFIARSIAGLISSVGILTKQGLGAFYPIFKDWESQNVPGYNRTLETRSWPLQNRPPFKEGDDAYRAKLVESKLTRPDIPPIKAVGVFDTAGSLGVPTIKILGFPIHTHSTREYAFTNTEVPRNVEHAYQALAIDERRTPFAPPVWEKPADGSGAILQELKQTWFPGVHKGVGGGYPDTSSADITLAWMITQLSPFLDFDISYIARQREQNVQFYEVSSPPNPVYSWGLGLLAPSDLGWDVPITGRTVRTPGEYHATDANTGVILPRRLVKTCEFIHPSVRYRIEQKGAAVASRADDYANMGRTPYYPEALKDFVLVKGLEADDFGGKQWQGRNKWVVERPAAEVVYIVEDEIKPGTAEMQLLRGWAGVEAQLNSH